MAATRDNIFILSTLLTDAKAQVRAAALGALMSITVNVDAKKTMSTEKLIPRLMGLLDDGNELVLVNCIKTITNCAEDYRSRYQLTECVDKVRVLMGGDWADVHGRVRGMCPLVCANEPHIHSHGHRYPYRSMARVQLKEHSRSSNDQLAHAAETAIRVITWRP
jgi:hypothetical protein